MAPAQSSYEVHRCTATLARFVDVGSPKNTPLAITATRVAQLGTRDHPRRNGCTCVGEFRISKVFQCPPFTASGLDATLRAMPLIELNTRPNPLFGAVIVLGASGAAPFFYTLF